MNEGTKAIDAESQKLMGKDNTFGASLWGDLPGARMTLKAISEAGTMDDVKKVAAILRKLPVDDPNMGKGVWAGQKQFGIAQELFFPFGVGIIKDGKEVRRIHHSAAALRRAPAKGCPRA